MKIRMPFRHIVEGVENFNSRRQGYGAPKAQRVFQLVAGLFKKQIQKRNIHKALKEIHTNLNR